MESANNNLLNTNYLIIKMRCKKTIIPSIISLLILISFISADVYVGTCQGYISNTESQFIQGADVTATVVRCSVGCSQSTTSESDGYYDIANLNLPANEAVRVYAEKPTSYTDRNGNTAIEYGQETGNADPYQAARVDVTICLPPDTPNLVPEPGTHDNFATLEWTSYPDYKNLYEVRDFFRIDGSSWTQISNTIPPGGSPESRSRDVTGLSTGNHQWQVRSCVYNGEQQLCCSNTMSNTFNVGNICPTPPTLTPVPDTNPGEVSFEWTSGEDADEDLTHDIFCYRIIEEDEWQCTTKEDAVESPQLRDVFSCNYYQWRVRTCETDYQDHCCSSWANDGFIACGLECPPCICGSSSGGGGGGGGAPATCSSEKQALTLISSPTVEQEQEHPIKVKYFTSSNEKNLWFRVESNNFNFNDYPLSEISNSKAEFEITGKPKTGTTGPQNLTLNVIKGNEIIFSEPLNLRVTKPLRINIQRFVGETPQRKTMAFFILIIILILTSGIIYYYYKKYRKNNPKKPNQESFWKKIFKSQKKNKVKKK